MINFSICVIARNEEKSLPKLLLSLDQFKKGGGEVVVLDTGSTDQTVKIAKEWGCIVEEVGDKFLTTISEKQAREINTYKCRDANKYIVKEGQKIFDFASARNYCANLASNDMVSMPDADEVFTKLDITSVEDLIRQGYTQLEFQFVYAHDKKGNASIQFVQCKFYDRRLLRWDGIIHEVLIGEAKKILLDEKVFKIEHWQNETTDRSNYLIGLALDCTLHPKKDRQSHYFGRELMYKGFYCSAIEELKRHLTLGTWDAERAQSMIFIGDCFMFLKDDARALEYYHRAYGEYSLKREPLIKLGRYYFERKDWNRAIFYLEGCLNIKYSGFYADDKAHYKDLPYGMLYSAYWWAGDRVKSKMYYDLAVQLDPSNLTYQKERSFYYNDEEDKDLPTVSILIPTLNRPEGLERCIRSFANLNYPHDKLELAYAEDETQKGVARMLFEMIKKCSGDYVVYGADDMEFDKDCIRNAIKARGDNDLIAFNAGRVGYDNGNVCEHFMIKRSFVLKDLEGWIFDPDFHHVGVDNLLWAQCNKKIRCEDAIVTHHHFSHGAKMDETYAFGWSKAKEDRALLKIKLKELELTNQ